VCDIMSAVQPTVLSSPQAVAFVRRPFGALSILNPHRTGPHIILYLIIRSQFLTTVYRYMCLRMGKPSSCVTSHLGQLSLPSLQGR